MCVIAVSKRGAKQPNVEQLRNMFENNPDGAGYMYARDGVVVIHKGFMDFDDYYRTILEERFTKNDPVVYHFRISTQAGVNPQMTHPFPLTSNRELCEELDVECGIGIAHNGIILMTSDKKQTRFSDTAIFITDYMTKLIRTEDDMTDPATLTMIDYLTNSKWALMDGLTGDVVTVGKFINDGGILFSNKTYKPWVPPVKNFKNGYYYGKGYDYDLSDFSDFSDFS